MSKYSWRWLLEQVLLQTLLNYHFDDLACLFLTLACVNPANVKFLVHILAGCSNPRLSILASS